jgi:4-diphosphocytidyl-2-C-methyl-D-erythritol kinase
MLVFPNSKINLGLRVLDKRPDGFHNLSSVFYPIPYRDVIEVLQIEGVQDKYIYSGRAIPGSVGGNLCEKAVQLLREEFDFPTVSVHLHKLIAMGAGLGGGSSDASFLLVAIRELFDLKISNTGLEQMALKLGSDCPFFIENRPVSVSGRGEIFEPCTIDLAGYFMVVVTSDVHISTADAYANIRRTDHDLSPPEVIEKLPMTKWKSVLHNDFEGFAFEKFPELKSTKDALYKLGATYASMTGSGSAIYGFFEQEIDKKALTKAFGSQFWSAIL